MAFLLLLGLASGAAAQVDRPTFGGGIQFHGYDFGDGLGARAATLLMVPVAVHAPLTDELSLDLYSSWARGQVQQPGTEVLTMEGYTDTQVRAAYNPTPWILLTVAANLPTGDASHDTEEAVVSSILATDLLGFREANWGTGFGLTPGLATASQLGPWNVGIGASYRLAGDFEPEAGNDLTYEPGDETRLRIGVDRNVGEGGKITAGFTFQNFESDALDNRNLFQAGKRYRVDASWAFRAGASAWTIFGIDSWREEGDLTLDILDQTGALVGDTLVHTSSQNIAQVGVAGSIPLGTSFRLRPVVDFQVQSRDQGPGSGWLVGGGGDFPLRFFGLLDIYPQFKVIAGRIEAAPTGGAESGEDVSLFGGEAGITLRWQP